MNPSLIMLLEQFDKRSLNRGVLNKAYVWTRKLGQLMSRLYRLSIKLPCQSLLEPFERPLGVNVYLNPFSRLFMYSFVNHIYFLLDRYTHWQLTGPGINENPDQITPGDRSTHTRISGRV